MGLKANFSDADIDSFLNQKIERIKEAIISRLMYAGENFVKYAREGGTYLDQTGNLRSSIGYIILNNGNVITENFAPAKKGSDKSTGVAKGELFAKQIAKGFNTGYVLICVAGMNYAAAVESRGREVITGSSQLVESALKEALLKLKNKL